MTTFRGERTRRISAATSLAATSGTLAIATAVLALADNAAAKTPGRVYCYYGVCHRVRAIDEVTRLIGDIRQETASFYGARGQQPGSGPRTSSGEIFSSASRYRVSSSIYPDGTELLVWNPRNGRTAHVRVNDLGPFHGGRTLDLTRGLAEDMGISRDGVAALQVFVISAPSAAEARHDRARRFAATDGYLGTLDETSVRTLADDLVDRAMLVAGGGDKERPAAAPAPEAADVEVAAVESNPPDARVSARTPEAAPIAIAAIPPLALVPAAAARIPAPLPEPEAAGEPPGREVRPEVVPVPVETKPALLTADIGAAVPPPSMRSDVSQTVAGAARMTVRHDVQPAETMLSATPPWASGQARAYLLVAFTLTLATLLLARLRRPDYIAVGVRDASVARIHRVARPAEPSFAVAFRRLEGEAASRTQSTPATVSSHARSGALRHARYLIDAGEHAAAEAVIRKLLSDWEACFGNRHCGLAAPLRLWADCARDAGRLADAREIYGRALAVAEPEAGPETADILIERARLHLATRNHAAAAADAVRAERLYRACGARGTTVAALLLKAEARHGIGNAAGAEAALREAAVIAGPDDDFGACEVAVSLAHIVSARGASAEAACLLGTAIAALDRQLGLAPSADVRALDPVIDQRAIDGAVHVRRRAIELAAALGLPAAGRPLARLL